MYGALKKSLTVLVSANFLAFSLVTICLADSHQPVPCPTKAKQQLKCGDEQKNATAEVDKRGSMESPLVVEGPLPQSHRTSGDLNAKEERDYSSSEWWLVYITAILAAFTFGLMIYTAKLWGATRHTLLETKEAEERQLRAYLAVNMAKIRQQTIGEFQTLIEIKNFGQTPAYNVKVWSVLGAFEQYEPRIFVNSDAIDIYSMLGPGGSFELKVALRSQTTEQTQNILAGIRPIYLWGEIKYRDAFRAERGFKFRMVADFSIPERWGFKPTPDGNEEY